MITSSTPIDFGDAIIATAAVARANPADTTPYTVRWKTRSPPGIEATIAESDDAHTLAAAGDTHTLTFTPTAPGTWVVRVEVTGGVQQAAEVVFAVAPSRIRSAAST